MKLIGMINVSIKKKHGEKIRTFDSTVIGLLDTLSLRTSNQVIAEVYQQFEMMGALDQFQQIVGYGRQ